jgi:hypothetical protein
MNRLALILVALSLLSVTGCKRDPGRGFVIGTASGAAVVASNGVVLAMGQSNMVGIGAQNPAKAFQDATGIPTINCAVGGTYLGQWMTGSTYEEACAAMVPSGKKVIGILWYQGESDAFLGTTNWDQSFIKIAAGWRKRWGNGIPIVYAQLATADFSVGWGKTWDLIKHQQETLSISKGRVVFTDDLPRRDDVHLTGDACIEVGRRMAQVFDGLN